jgi:hypothetical protein
MSSGSGIARAGRIHAAQQNGVASMPFLKPKSEASQPQQLSKI